jgi:hypothetical protein
MSENRFFCAINSNIYIGIIWNLLCFGVGGGTVPACPLVSPLDAGDPRMHRRLKLALNAGFIGFHHLCNNEDRVWWNSFPLS